MKGMVVVLCASLLSSFLCACVGMNEEAVSPGMPAVSDTQVPVADGHYPCSVETYDSSRNRVTRVFRKKPQRVIVYGRNMVETLLALGQGTAIVQTTLRKGGPAYEELAAAYPEEFSKIRNVDDYTLDRETATYLKPDCIIGWRSTFTRGYLGTTEEWQGKGVNTYIVATSNHVAPCGTIEDEYQCIRDMGAIFDAESKANEIIEDIQKEISSMQEMVKGERQPVVMVIEITERYIANYDDRWIVGDMVKQLGGCMPIDTRSISTEELISVDPDVIFCVYFTKEMKDGISSFFENPKVSSLKAVREKRIYPIRLDYMYTPQVKLKEGMAIIGHGLYPDRIPEQQRSE